MTTNYNNYNNYNIYNIYNNLTKFIYKIET